MAAVFENITGVILAGGQSTRFGEDKAFARLNDIPLIFRVLKAVKSLFSELLLVTNSPDQFRCLPASVIRDDVPQQGPLGGIATALRRAKHDRIFVVACDMPLLDPSEIHKVILAANGCEAAIPVHGNRQEYLMALYSRCLLEPLSASLRAGKLSLKEFFENKSHIRWVPIAGDCCFNVNTKRDLLRLETNHAV